MKNRTTLTGLAVIVVAGAAALIWVSRDDDHAAGSPATTTTTTTTTDPPGADGPGARPRPTLPRGVVAGDPDSDPSIGADAGRAAHDPVVREYVLENGTRVVDHRGPDAKPITRPAPARPMRQ